MKTLTILIIIWGIVSYIRLKKKSEGGKFNPFNGTFFDYIGFLIGASTIISTIIILALIYLP
jgi:multisubunit Na+/H+ antiporter MnhB subunit